MLENSVLGKLYSVWTYSFIFNILQTVYRCFSRAFANSKIIHIFVKPSNAETIYQDSFVAKVFHVIPDVILGGLGKFFAFIKRMANGSITEKIINRFFISSEIFNFEVFLGGFILLMFFIPHDYWSNSLAFLGIFALFILLRMFIAAKSRRPFYVSDMGLPFLLFGMACIISLLFTLDISDSIRVLIFFVTGLLCSFVIAADIDSKERLMKLLFFIYIAVILTSLYAIYQRAVGVAVNASFTDLTLNKGVPGRVYSTLDNPNNFAEFLVIMTPLAAVYTVNSKFKHLRPLMCISILIPFLALMMTYSRSCWISMVITCIIFVYYSNKKLIPIFILLGVAAIPFLPDSIIIRINSLFNSTDSSNLYRLYIWEGTTKIVRDNFFTGIGLGPSSFATVYPFYANPKAILGVPHSHMVYMELFIELGLLGFISFMWYMLRLWKDTGCAILKQTDKTIKAVKIACIGSLIGIAFAFGVEYVWYYPRTMFAYFILIGITVSTLHMKDEQYTNRLESISDKIDKT